jgi:hypothetical protein
MYNTLHYFDLLESNVAKFGFTPDKIFNVDESGFSTVPKRPYKIVAKEGEHQVGVVAGGERGSTPQSSAQSVLWCLHTAYDNI